MSDEIRLGMASDVVPMDQNPMDLKASVQAAEKWDSTFAEIRSDIETLAFEEGAVINGGRSFQMNQTDRTRLFNTIGAPGKYLERHSLSFQAEALTEHVSRGDFGRCPIVVLQNDQAVTILRERLLRLPNASILRAVQDELGDEGEGLEITNIVCDFDRLDVELVSPSKAIAVRAGDVVQSGLHISHQRFGRGATAIEGFMYRLVCSNGTTRRVCVNDSHLRTRRLPLDFPKNTELQINQIRRLTRLNWEGLQDQLEAMRGTSEQPAEVETLLTRWLMRARISVKLMLPRLLAAWRQEGAEDTVYAGVNALTRVATHERDLSERQRRMLASLAGLLSFADVHICEKCFSVLTNGAMRRELDTDS